MHCLLWSPSRSFYVDELTTHVMVRSSHQWKQIVSGKIKVSRKKIVLAYKNSRFKVASTAGSRSSGASSLLTTLKKGKAKGAAPPQHANKLTASPPCKLAKGKPQLEANRNHPRDEASEPRVRGRMIFGAKHAGKTATEILDQHGFAEIREAAEEVLGTWCEPPFTTALLGENFIEFKESCTQLKTKACSIKWKIMRLRKKILKWKVIPDGVLQMATAWINKITAIHDSLGQFNLRSNQGGDTNMMKACMDCMASYSIDTPNAMKVVFFREKSSPLGDG